MQEFVRFSEKKTDTFSNSLLRNVGKLLPSCNHESKNLSMKLRRLRASNKAFIKPHVDFSVI